MSKVTGTIRNVYAECECPQKDHVVLFELAMEDPAIDPVLTVSPMLHPDRTWWRRVLIAIKYVFKPYPLTYMHYDDVVLTQDSILKIAKMVELYSWVKAIRHAKRDRVEREKNHG